MSEPLFRMFYLAIFILWGDNSAERKIHLKSFCKTGKLSQSLSGSESFRLFPNSECSNLSLPLILPAYGCEYHVFLLPVV